MKMNGNSRRILFGALEGDEYGLKTIPQNSIESMLDIGAAYGLISIFAKLLHPRMRIVAIEPHSETFKDLCDNVKSLRIKCMNSAFGNGDSFYLFKERKTRLCNSFTAEFNGSEPIKSVRLHRLVRLRRINVDSLAIKIDCEGAEWHMIGNAKDENVIRKCKLLGIEVHEVNGRKTTEFYDWVKKLVGETHSITITNYTKTLGVIKAIRKELV